MSRNEDIFYQAMLARDFRFDGKFFVAVKTTGIYCRPICPAKPKRENVEFFSNALHAEKAGYRPCLRCRPEAAPGSPVWIGTSSIVKRALKMIHEPQALEWNEDRFAERFGVSARHLRRLFVDEFGKTPKQIAYENRLNLARKLVTESGLSMTDVAYASGFDSLRRFNAAFKERFKKSPSQLKRVKGGDGKITLTLSYRPPFDFKRMLRYYRSHRVGELESFDNDTYSRRFRIQGQTGQLWVIDLTDESRLKLVIECADPAIIYEVVSRVRRMFDLDSDPLLIANAFESDRELNRVFKKHPGLRLPTGWDPFETAMGTILGQLVSLEQAARLVADLIREYGEDGYFPTIEKLAKCDLAKLKTTGKRKETIRIFCQALLDEKISLESTQSPSEFIERILDLSGIGQWTADYMALRVLGHTDAFPSTDLILKRALEIHPEGAIEKLSPWRGYVAMLIWAEYHEKLQKKREPKRGKK